jgi:hypothetical protein
MLDTFDARARPLAVVYDPLRLVRPEAIPPLLTLAASRESRYGRQPLRVFLNARFALPAGDYEVEIGGVRAVDGAGTPTAGTVGLQVGRLGSPLREWRASIEPGGSWRAAFSLPVDAEFVGFRTSSSLEAATTLRLQPVRVTSVTQRAPGPPVLSAAAYGPAAVFFRGDQVWPEPQGFWIRGRSTLTAAVVKTGGPPEELTLKLHSGARPNTVTVETPFWSERVALVPKVPREVRVPARARHGVISLRVTTADGFVPADVSPPSPDRRLLGCWVEIVG